MAGTLWCLNRWPKGEQCNLIAQLFLCISRYALMQIHNSTLLKGLCAIHLSNAANVAIFHLRKDNVGNRAEQLGDVLTWMILSWHISLRDHIDMKCGNTGLKRHELIVLEISQKANYFVNRRKWKRGARTWVRNISSSLNERWQQISPTSGTTGRLQRQRTASFGPFALPVSSSFKAT